jgi:hypothetical protein
MPDWRQQIRARLARVTGDTAREHDIVDEIAQGLDDTYQEALATGCSEEDAVKILLPNWARVMCLRRNFAERCIVLPPNNCGMRWRRQRGPSRSAVKEGALCCRE